MDFKFHSFCFLFFLDHFGYRAPDFSFIHELIWYDLGRFENWLIDRRGLNLGDVVPLGRADYQALPSLCLMKARPAQLKKKSQQSCFTAQKSQWQWMGSFFVQSNCRQYLAISSIEKLDGIESFMAPVTEEVIEKADALLKV